MALAEVLEDLDEWIMHNTLWGREALPFAGVRAASLGRRGDCRYIYGCDAAGQVTACMLGLGCDRNGHGQDCGRAKREAEAQERMREAPENR